MSAWYERSEVVSYICDAYAGTDTVGERQKERRLFLWREGPNVVMGNVEAFFNHMCLHFGLTVSPLSGTSRIHLVLRELGERIAAEPDKHHGPPVHKAHRPEPQSWVVERRS